MYTEINSCRICGNEELITIADLGSQPLTGVFLKPDEDDPLSAPLELACCSNCKFLQLKHDVDKDLMYKSYFYRSGTNKTMTDHLEGVVGDIKNFVQLEDGDGVIDTGCNDGTLLSFYDSKLNRLGVDPSNAILNIKEESGIGTINNFFTAENVRKYDSNFKAKVISSISMFYDLSDPERFVEDVKELLTEDGLWVVEMNYTGDMIENMGFDMISHEHVAYYTFLTFEYLIKRCGLHINHVSWNTINGGSIRLFVQKFKAASDAVNKLRSDEINKGYETLEVYEGYRDSIKNFVVNLKKLIADINEKGQKVMAYGASTRGNTVMQACEFTKEDIPAALDRLPLKYGLQMSGCRIPIISEEEGRNMNPDFLLILPYYFLEEFKNREIQYLKNGGKFIVFLPETKIISWKNDTFHEELI